MKVTLIEHTKLSNVAQAIRTCWQSQDKGGRYPQPTDDLVDVDKKLIDRVVNKFKHESTVEHAVYTFHIQGVSRALLQEFSRHRLASPSVKSSRYTLKELKEHPPFIHFVGLDPVYRFDEAESFVKLTGNPTVDIAIVDALESLRDLVSQGVSNDLTKYAMPEAYLVDLVWTINARSLRNFIKLRSSKDALWEIRELAKELFDVLPEQHKFLFKDCLNV